MHIVRQCGFIRWLMLIGSFLLPASGYAQTEQCLASAQTALDTLQQACDETAVNQLCFGHTPLNIIPQADAEDQSFSAPGDVVTINGMQSISLAATEDSFGVARMQVQANRSGSRGGVTMLLFGDMELENQIRDSTLVDVQAVGGVNVRQRPTVNGALLASLTNGQTVIADGQLADHAWLRIRLPDTRDQWGWVASNLVHSEGDLDELPIMEATDETTVLWPMQSLKLQTAADEPGCDGRPNSGILLQASVGRPPALFRINGVDVQFDGVVFVRAPGGQELIINMIDGPGHVRLEGVDLPIAEGAQLRIPLSADGQATGLPALPEPYGSDEVQALPVELLPRRATVAEPASQAEINDLIDLQTACRITTSSPVTIRLGPGTIYSPSSVSFPPNVSRLVIGSTRGEEGFIWWQIGPSGWLREDVVVASGDCERVAFTPLDEVEISARAHIPQDATLNMNTCQLTGAPVIPENTPLVIFYTLPNNLTFDIASELVFETPGSFTLDETQTLPLFIGRRSDEGAVTETHWTTQSGTHTITMVWREFRATCAFVIP